MWALLTSSTAVAAPDETLAYACTDQVQSALRTNGLESSNLIVAVGEVNANVCCSQHADVNIGSQLQVAQWLSDDHTALQSLLESGLLLIGCFPAGH